MQDLWVECMATLDKLDELVQDMRQSGCQLAENERDYRVALRVEILNERASGVPASVVGDTSRGVPDIADMKRDRDCSDAVYKAAQEAINVNKLRLRVINDQIAREWAQHQ